MLWTPVSSTAAEQEQRDDAAAAVEPAADSSRVRWSLGNPERLRGDRGGPRAEYFTGCEGGRITQSSESM